MKLKLITVTVLSALALGGSAFANDPSDANYDRHGGRGFRHNPLERITDDLNLTADQQTKVQPILDQARPQLEQIHREAMEKTRAVMQNTMAQIRPLLTPEQQQKLDQAKNNGWGHRGGRHHHGGNDDSDTGD